MLIWENCARLIVSSANLTRSGYRKNREIAGVVDFFDDENCAPRRLILDAIAFLRDVGSWVRRRSLLRPGCRAPLRMRLLAFALGVRCPRTLNPVNARASHSSGAYPGRGVAWPVPIQQMLELWGTRRVSEVTVMTPFVGDLVGTADPVVEKLLELPRTRERRSGVSSSRVIRAETRDEESGRWSASSVH